MSFQWNYTKFLNTFQLQPNETQNPVKKQPANAQDQAEDNVEALADREYKIVVNQDGTRSLSKNCSLKNFKLIQNGRFICKGDDHITMIIVVHSAIPNIKHRIAWRKYINVRVLLIIISCFEGCMGQCLNG